MKARFAAFLSCIVFGLFACPGGPAEARPITIVAFGDSNTAGFLSATEQTYPYRLEKLLRARGYDVRIRNSGISGNTSGMGLARMDAAVPPGTDLAIVFFGRNDIRFGLGEARLRRNLDTMVDRLRARNIAVVLCGQYGFEFSDIAKKHGAVYFPDFFAGTAVKGVKKPEYTRVLDPLRHLNGAGYAVVVEAMLPLVERLVIRAGASRNSTPQ
jgi:acyl-CoA thioesterase-1